MGCLPSAGVPSLVIVRRFNGLRISVLMVPRKIRVKLCIETETDFLGLGKFFGTTGFFHVLRATKIIPTISAIKNEL